MLQINKKIILAVLVVFFMRTAQSQNDSTNFESMSLNDVKAYAVKNNYEAKNSVLDVSIAKQKKWETTAMGLPQFNVSLDYQYIFDVPSMSLPLSIAYAPDPTNPYNHMHIDTAATFQLGSKSSANLNFTVSQLIFSGEYIVGLKAAKIYSQLSEKNKVVKEEEIKENVSKTYYLILVSEQSLKVLDSVLTNLKKLQFQTSKISDAGFAEATDVGQIDLNIKTTENSIISFNNQKDLLYKMLKFQSGIDVNDTIVLTDNLDDILNNIEQESTQNEVFNIQNNSTYKLLEVQENLTELNLQREKSTYLPTVSAFYRHQEQINAPAFNFNPPDVVGVSVQVPIFSSGKRNSMVQQRKMELYKVQNSKLQAEQGLYIQAEQSRTEYESAYKSFKNSEQSKLLAQKIYENNLTKFQTGTQSSLYLSQAHNQYFMALSEYYKAMSNLLETQVKLNKILNKL